MAMNVGTSGGQGGGDGDVMLDINTTPLIDVMLVLLVMLIITIPIQLHSVNLNMPVGNPPPPLVLPEVVKIDIDDRGAIYWNGEVVPDRATLEQKITAGAARGPPAARQGIEIFGRCGRDGIGATIGADQDRHRRQ
jgi:biopolymer transport protein ExbD